jgi:hypothetical protein
MKLFRKNRCGLGDRYATSDDHFMNDLQERLASRVQLTSYGHKAYLQAREDRLGANIDLAQPVKIYGNQTGNEFLPKSDTALRNAWERAKLSFPEILITTTFQQATRNTRTSQCA